MLLFGVSLCRYQSWLPDLLQLMHVDGSRAANPSPKQVCSSAATIIGETNLIYVFGLLVYIPSEVTFLALLH
jgi:hypothetical protein